ncbi:MAG TPA: hypothetical protein VJL29_06735 [Thermoguttaceae bacterium]|nr:hypothetical protein [Thermoguttaceae bacterium]
MTSEKWYADVDDTTADHVFEYDYDLAGRLASAAEGDDADQDGLEPGEIASAYSYEYDGFDRLVSNAQDLAGLDHDVLFEYTYNSLDLVASVAAPIDDGVDVLDDYLNTYRLRVLCPACRSRV